MTFRPEPHIQALTHLRDRLARLTDRGPAYQAFYAEVSQYASAVQALAELHSRRDPTITEAAHIKKVATYAKQLEKMIDPSFARMSRAVTAQFNDLDRRKGQKVQLKPDSYAPEVRQVYRQLPMKDQLKMLQQLADENRGAELAAILRAPRVLTGLSEEHAKRFEELIYEKNAPEEHAEALRLDEEFSNALAAVDPLKAVIAAYSNPQALAEITKAEQAATKAAREFRDATGQP